MKKNYRVFITNGMSTDSFTMLGRSHSQVKELCDIVHLGTGWVVESVILAKRKPRVRKSEMCNLFNIE